MAKAPSKKPETTITRIKASDTSKSSTKKSVATQPKKAAKLEVKKTASTTGKSNRKNPLNAIGAYFAGAWYELRQVRWPDRAATWGMTGALIAFTAFFILVILLLDFGFSQLFQLITGK